jgi:UDP-N-acetylglucosamine 2-epimerase (non-hydrolysing)
MIDTLTWAQPVMDALVPEVQRRLPKLQGKSFGIATIHRPSNVDDPHALQEVITFLQDVAIYCPIALPAHPRLQKALDASSLLRRSNPSPLLIIPPMDYLRFITFMRASAFILTDSGGIQEEAVLLRKRCFTLRRNTERPSTVESGSNILIDPNKEADRQIVIDYAKDPKPPHIEIPPFWDGKAGKRIIDKLS